MFIAEDWNLQMGNLPVCIVEQPLGHVDRPTEESAMEKKVSPIICMSFGFPDYY